MTATTDLDVLPLEWMDRGDQPALDFTAAAPAPAKPARTASALRWVDGAGTCLVPCTIVRKLERNRYLIRFEDGVETNAPAEYVAR